MRSTFMYLFYKSPFENLRKHAETLRKCAKLFAEAVHHHLEENFAAFDSITDQVAALESHADSIKRNIRGHMPKGVMMPVDKFQFFMYLREQDAVLDAMEYSLYWLSYRHERIEGELAEDLRFLVTSVLPAAEKILPLVEMSIDYFRTRAEEERKTIKALIRDIRQQEHEADFLERELIRKAFSSLKEPLKIFYIVRLAETIGSIADHAQNASDMMRAMIGR